MPGPPSRLACRIWIGVAIAVGAVLLAQAETKALRPIGNDFTAYLEASRALAHGANPYLVSPMFPYSYPLTLAYLLIPLQLLPIWLAAAAWFAVTIGAFWIVTSASAAAGGRGLTKCEAVALCVIVAIALLQIVQNELLNGQINLVVAALSMSAVALSERRRPLPAAMLWGLGIALKLFPLILGPWFLLRRRWTELGVGLLAAAALCLLPVLWVGSDAVQWTSDYFRKIVGGEAAAPGVPDFIHLNLADAFARFAGFAAPPLWLTVATATALVGAATISDARHHLSRAAAAAYLALVVLVSPKSETHHMVFTFPAVVLLAVRARTGARLVALAALVLIFNIGFVTPAVRDPLLLVFACGVAAWCMAE